MHLLDIQHVTLSVIHFLLYLPLGIKVCLSLETNEENHNHINGYIHFCELCWWKEIESIEEHLIYFSTKTCSCLRKLHQKKEIKICTTMNTIEWTCTYCSIGIKDKKVKHLYLYPTKYDEDYEIFYICPEKRKNLTYPPTHINQKCFKCKKKYKKIAKMWATHGSVNLVI